MSGAATMDSVGRFGTAFADALHRNGTTLVEFARMIDGSYENLRKVYKGLSLPGQFIVEMCIKHLKMDRQEVEKLIAQDRIEKKVGKRAMQSVFGRHPRMGEFDALIPLLTEDQIDGILAQIRATIKHNRLNGR
jgi:hypothetical protein